MPNTEPFRRLTLIRNISECRTAEPRLVFCLSDASQDLCARCVRKSSPSATVDVESGLVMSRDVYSGAKLRPREPF